jgi:hypothetical protein
MRRMHARVGSKPTRNFKVIRRWNEVKQYALRRVTLSQRDRLSAGPGFCTLVAVLFQELPQAATSPGVIFDD